VRVFHVQKATGVGGSERHLLSLLPGLAARGVQPRLCVLGAGDVGRLRGPLQERGIDAAEVAAGSRVNPLLVRRLVREIRAFDPDLVHTHLIHGQFYGQLAARVAGIPAVHSMHGTQAFFHREPYRSLVRGTGRWARRTIAISEYVRTFLLRHRLAPADRIRVVPYGIDATGWLVGDAERNQFRQELGLHDGDVAVTAASRLIPGKGHDLLIDAFGLGVQQFPSLRLLVAGDGPLRGSLEARAGARAPEGSVWFLGYRSDMRSLMGASDILAFPTSGDLGEGFGLAALEAMAAGRPVVATRVGSLPEIVSHEETGLLVEPGDPERLSEALVTLAVDPGLRRRLGDKGRERASTSFALDSMVDRTLSVYREVLEGDR
jgi:glycosyltransferase involved in cell wall biosynthesis